MTIKTPEQIAEDVISANYDDPESADVLADLVDARALSAYDIRSLIAAAVEADRTQRIAPGEALRIAREHGYIVKAWHEDDIRSQVEREGGLTDEQVDRIVEEAQASYYWHALEDCTDRDWDLVSAAIGEARDSLNAGEARA